MRLPCNIQFGDEEAVVVSPDGTDGSIRASTAVWHASDRRRMGDQQHSSHTVVG